MDILFEDEDFIAVNKPAGLLSHPNKEGEESVEGWVREYLGRMPVLFHRLDQETTGVLLLGKSKRFAAEVRKLFDDHKVRKSYWALVEGEWPAQMNRLEGEDSEGKTMLSTCRVLKKDARWTLLEVLLKTGRQHQIRLQCTAAGHPVLGDRRYGGTQEFPGLALHCRELRFQHPGTSANLAIMAPIPDSWPKAANPL